VGDDFATGIALGQAEFSEPSSVFIADLTKATFTSGSPAGAWTDTAAQSQTRSESFLSAGASGIAVGAGHPPGIVSGEFGGDEITAVSIRPNPVRGPDWHAAPDFRHSHSG
jgi:hypothetical protein